MAFWGSTAEDSGNLGRRLDTALLAVATRADLERLEAKMVLRETLEERLKVEKHDRESLDGKIAALTADLEKLADKLEGLPKTIIGWLSGVMVILAAVVTVTLHLSVGVHP
jgi:hypothetical protein